MISCNQQFKTDSQKAATIVSTDPLPSWNEGASKQAIIGFITKTTKEGSPDFIPVADRIACFDNDGTLWTEQPLPFQLFFVIDRIKAMAPQHPEWKNKQPFKSVLEGDLKTALAGGEKAMLEMMMVTHAGMTTDEFYKSVKDWMATATHPKTGRHYNEMVYQPMLELLNYLRANGYKPFIISGGGIDFMRVWAEDAYGIPPYQVVGSSFKTQYDTSVTPPVLIKLAEINFNDDKLGKPVGIYEHIGKRPVFTAGNSDGDWAMMQYTSTGIGPRFGMFVHHTDSVREYAYGADPGLAQLKKGLEDAAKYHWVIVDMKNDWKTIYPFDGKSQSEIAAIDVLLDPDQTMLDSAKVYNDLMRENYNGPGSYSLDTKHAPHITVLQCFVRTADLEKVYAAVSVVVKSEQPAKEILTANGLYYLPYNGLGLEGITIQATPDILRFQEKVIQALKPYFVNGTTAAFIQNADGTPVARPTADYVNKFVTEHSGAKYNPHVTIGLAHEDFLKELLAKPYHTYTFKSSSVSIYQLGDFGTAQKKLWSSATTPTGVEL
jgi:phosphoglycolate phosphatase-like HAD superfamily hydrolase